MHLTFNRRRVDRLLAHTKGAQAHTPLYDDPKTAKPGLWLAGDQGVYLLSNGQPRLLAPLEERPHGDTTAQYVCYADEANPIVLAFDLWWEAKRRSFGGDDGIEFLLAESIERALASSHAGAPLVLDVSPKEITFVGGVRRDGGGWTWPRLIETG